MDAVLTNLAYQLPVAVLFLIAAYYGLHEMKSFISQRDEQWQAFLEKQQAQNDKRINDRDEQQAELIKAIKELTESVMQHDKKVEQGMTRMYERTRQRKDD